MADKNPLTPEEVTELFSEIDASGVLDPTLAKKRTERMREKEAAVKRGDKAALAQLRSEDRASQAKHIDLSAFPTDWADLQAFYTSIMDVGSHGCVSLGDAATCFGRVCKITGWVR